MFLQPFYNKSWKSGAGVGFNMELTQNWEFSTTTLFLNPIVNGVTKLGKQIVQLAVGPRIPLAGPNDGETDFGWRAVIVLVFPK
jgi:hypothetical protein